MAVAADYARLEEETGERHEYWDGELRLLGNFTHQHSLISTRILAALFVALQGREFQPLTIGMRVTSLATGMEAYPDAMVLCGNPHFAGSDGLCLTNPLVLVEVLSKLTEANDRGRKFAHYRTIPSLKEYVLVAQDRVLVERFQRMEGGAWLLTTYSTGALALDSIGSSIPIESIYDGVSLQQDDRR